MPGTSVPFACFCIGIAHGCLVDDACRNALVVAMREDPRLAQNVERFTEVLIQASLEATKEPTP